MSRLLTLDPDFKPAFDGVDLAKRAVGKLASQAEVIEAYLFGSSVEKKNTIDSDLDILVVIPNEKEPRLYYSIVGQGFFASVAIDWIIKTENDRRAGCKRGGVSFLVQQMGIRVFP